MKKIVVYFSRTGENSVNGEMEYISKGFTEIVAEKIASFTGAELYKLMPENPYPANYEECVARSRKEDQENAKVPFLNPKDNLNDYDVIYLGEIVLYSCRNNGEIYIYKCSEQKNEILISNDEIMSLLYPLRKKRKEKERKKKLNEEEK